MKKLLYITTNLQNSGGVARILSVKLNYLIEKYDYNISVINSNQKNNIFFYDFNGQIKFFSINTNHLFEYKKELNVLINNIEPDIIVNCDNGLKGSLLPYLINSKAPLIYERHCGKNISIETLIEKFKLMASNFILERSINKYKEFIVLNDKEKQDWDRSDIQIIPNPLWLNLKHKKKECNSKIAIAVGRHSFEKRLDRLIAIWAKVVEKHPDWGLKIYGERNKNIQLEKLVNKLNIEKNIQFNNPTNDVEKIYSEACMLLTTSVSESFGLVLIEAMAFGIPVIAFGGTSGTETLIDDGVNGFLVKQNETKTYIEKTNLLIENAMQRKQMGENARKSLESFNIDYIMILWHNLFQSIK